MNEPARQSRLESSISGLLRTLQVLAMTASRGRLVTISFLIFFFPNFTYGYSKIEAKEPPKIGNFALSSSQQPGPLISFGQKIIGKNQTQLSLFIDDFSGIRKHAVDLVPAILYGITDDFSVFFNAPIAASYEEDKTHSSGLGDAFSQFEYAFYTKQTSNFSEQATIVTNITFPTGSSQKQPPTGFGSPSFFLGGTFNRTYVDWFGFISDGVVQTTSHDGIKFGNEFLYQCGLGRNILTIDSKWIFAGMVEVDGQYMERSKIRDATDFNSGGNIVYITPSLWVSSKKLIIQLGIGFPVVQNLFGEQKENNYLLAANFTWTF